MRALADTTRSLCRRAARSWDAGRSRRFFEQAWIARALAGVPADGAVLDLGCGAGEPIVAQLIARGFDVTGGFRSGDD